MISDEDPGGNQLMKWPDLEITPFLCPESFRNHMNHTSDAASPPSTFSAAERRAPASCGGNPVCGHDGVGNDGSERFSARKYGFEGVGSNGSVQGNSGLERFSARK